ncbi:conserved hypothetical signal peptide protein [Klebsiella variicola]|nr:conserved hypothetical signal peptide protein [Klebsiella variicola]
MKLHSKGKLKTLAALTILSVALGMGVNTAVAADMSHGADNFYKSDKSEDGNRKIQKYLRYGSYRHVIYSPQYGSR